MRILKLCRPVRVVEEGVREVTGVVIQDRYANELLRIDEQASGRVTHESEVAVLNEVANAINTSNRYRAALRRIRRLGHNQGGVRSEESEIAQKALRGPKGR